MSDKRKQARKQIAGRLPIIDANSGLVIGDLVNISMLGFMVLAPSALSPSAVYQMSMSLPQPINGENMLNFGAECLWCNATEDQDNCWVGFQIIDMSSHDQDLFEQFLTMT